MSRAKPVDRFKEPEEDQAAFWVRLGEEDPSPWTPSPRPSPARGEGAGEEGRGGSGDWGEVRRRAWPPRVTCRRDAGDAPKRPPRISTASVARVRPTPARTRPKSRL